MGWASGPGEQCATRSSHDEHTQTRLCRAIEAAFSSVCQARSVNTSCARRAFGEELLAASEARCARSRAATSRVTAFEPAATFDLESAEPRALSLRRCDGPRRALTQQVVASDAPRVTPVEPRWAVDVTRANARVNSESDGLRTRRNVRPRNRRIAQHPVGARAPTRTVGVLALRAAGALNVESDGLRSRRKPSTSKARNRLASCRSACPDQGQWGRPRAARCGCAQRRE